MKTRLTPAWLLLTLSAARTHAQAPGADAAIAARYDIVGIKVGMTLKEAMAALKAHNPNLRLKPENLQYASIPQALTYAISGEGAAEVFYFLVTMPPGPPVVSKITWTGAFTPQSAPKQDEVVATLVQKYGPVTWDTLPASLSLGSRDVVWVDDAHGARLKGHPPSKCLALTTFFMNGPAPNTRTQFGATNIQISPVIARIRVDEGYANRRESAGDACAEYTMVRARLFRMKTFGVSVPNLISYLTLTIGSGPLDRSATNATHRYVAEQVKNGGRAERPH
jgi:hypothetical protein